MFGSLYRRNPMPQKPCFVIFVKYNRIEYIFKSIARKILTKLLTENMNNTTNNDNNCLAIHIKDISHIS